MNKTTTNCLIRYPTNNSNCLTGTHTTILLLAVLCIFINNQSLALTINNSHDNYLLTPSMSWFEDSSGLLTINEITTPHIMKQFRKNKEKIFNIGFQHTAIWFYIPLQHVSEPEKRLQKKQSDTSWLLSIDYPQLDLIDIYTKNNTGNIIHQQLGDSLPFHQRPIKSLNYVLPVTINEGKSVEFFIRVQSSSLLKMPISLHSPKSILQYQMLETGIYSMYFGIMIIMVLYNAFIYFTVKESSYILYILHISFVILWQACLSGHAYAYLWPNSAHWAQLSPLLFLCLACFFLLKFSQHFFTTWEQLPYINTLLTMNSWFVLAATLMVIFIPYQVATILGIILLTLCITSVIFTSALSLKSSYQTARFCLLAWCFLLISMSIQAADISGLIPTHIISARVSLLGTLLEGLLLSLALADRVNYQRRKNQQFAQNIQKQLQVSNKELSNALTAVEQSNRLKDQFLGTISHELRTPMNGVEGALELIDTKTLGEQQNHYIDIAKISANDMTSVIDSILRFSEIQSGKLQLKSEVYELRYLLNPTLVKYRHQCQQKGLLFNYHIDKDVPMLIIGDSEQTLLVIKQLIDNAIKFTDFGEVKVDIYIQELPKKLLCITVTDSGLGIPEDQQNHVFDAFYQLDGNYNRQHTGLGIGLTLCHQLAKIMEGVIDIESGNHKGTAMTFSIPLRVSTTSLTEDTDNEFSINERQKTILIAEDNPINQMILKGMLQTTGCMILTANNGEQVLKILQSKPVHLIMMDCQMPIIDGFEATRIIRKSNTAYKNVPIIAVTANAMTSDNTRCLRAGMNDYIKKPVNFSVVINKTRRWLQSNKVATIPPLRQVE